MASYSVVGLLSILCRSYERKSLLVSKHFVRLFCKAVTLAPQTMILERFISIYERIKCNLRICLTNETLNDIMMVKINGPSLVLWDLRPLVQAGLIQKIGVFHI